MVASLIGPSDGWRKSRPGAQVAIGKLQLIDIVDESIAIEIERGKIAGHAGALEISIRELKVVRVVDASLAGCVAGDVAEETVEGIGGPGGRHARAIKCRRHISRV